MIYHYLTSMQAHYYIARENGISSWEVSYRLTLDLFFTFSFFIDLENLLLAPYFREINKVMGVECYLIKMIFFNMNPILFKYIYLCKYTFYKQGRNTANYSLLFITAKNANSHVGYFFLLKCFKNSI